MTTTGQESEPKKVETTFELLACAKKLETESSFWLATEKFVQAHGLLKALAAEETQKATEDGSAENENSQMIAQLYSSKADEYWKQSRKCLIRAMEQEKASDEQQQEEKGESSTATDNACALLDDEQARARNRSFSVLFSRPLVEESPEQPKDEEIPEASAAAAAEEEETNIADEDDLEARLRALNQSLPSGFKSVSERMSDVNKGLGKLGVSSVYTQPTRQFAPEDELPKDEDEQIDEILAQARDEAMMDKMDKNHRGGETAQGVPQRTATIDDDDDVSDFGDDSDSADSEEDELLDHDQLGMKTIHKKVVKAQVKLAELLAIVDQARSKRAKEDMDEEEAIYKNNRDEDYNSDDDDDSFPEVQKHDVAFLMMTGKKKLKRAQRDLKQALVEWDGLIL